MNTLKYWGVEAAQTLGLLLISLTLVWSFLLIGWWTLTILFVFLFALYPEN